MCTLQLRTYFDVMRQNGEEVKSRQSTGIKLSSLSDQCSTPALAMTTRQPPLLVRCDLFLVFAFNISGDDSVNLLVISSATFGIFLWLTFSGVVYKSWYLNALEVSFILNFAVATIYVNQSCCSPLDCHLPHLPANQIKSAKHTVSS